MKDLVCPCSNLGRAGVRVVTSDTPELREAVGEDAIYVDPTETGIRTGISLALETETASPIDWRNWDWTRSASVLATVLLNRTENGQEPIRPTNQMPAWPVRSGQNSRTLANSQEKNLPGRQTN
jgi:hypothetical protein